MKRPHLGDYLSTLLLVGLLPLASCTTTIKPGARDTHYAAGEKIHLKLALNLTDELRNAKWEQRALTGGGTVMAVGPALTQDAPQFARSTFMEVVEINNGSSPSKPVDATLTPKMAFIGIDYGQTIFSNDTITIKFEWTLADQAGNGLWADNITGNGRSKAGCATDCKLAV